MDGSPLKNLKMFRSICGQAAMPRVCLVTTMWNDVSPDTGARREQELKAVFWNDMINAGCIVQRSNNSYESAWKITGKLPTERENVMISREIYDAKKNFNETAAAVRISKELQSLIQDQKDAANRLEEQIKKQDNGVLLEELMKRRAEIEERIGSVTQELQALKIPAGTRIKNFFTGRKARKLGLT